MDTEGPIKELTHRQWCVFYNEKTGEIVHVHEYLAASSDMAISQNDLEAQAQALLDPRLQVKKLRILHLPEEMRPELGAEYSVDIRSRTLKVNVKAQSAVRTIRKGKRTR